MAQWQRVHFFDELEKHGCYINVFNPINYPTTNEANEKLINYIRNNKYDLFITPYGNKELYLETLKLIKSSGLPTLLICFDNLSQPFIHKNICKHYDLVWLTSRDTEHMFLKWGAKTLFIPYAANPFYFSIKSSLETRELVFIGTPHGNRANIINSLTDNKINVHLFANIKKSNPSYQKPPLVNYIVPMINYMRFDIGRRIIAGAIKQRIEKTGRLNVNSSFLHIKGEGSTSFMEMNKIYSDYALSLSSTTWRNTDTLRNPVNVVDLKCYEIPMCGGLLFSRYSDELASYFEEDKEIIYYRTNEEMIEKAIFYLKPENDNLRITLKKNARKKAENEHTWFIRFKKVFDYLGLSYQR